MGLGLGWMIGQTSEQIKKVNNASIRPSSCCPDLYYLKSEINREGKVHLFSPFFFLQKQIGLSSCVCFSRVFLNIEHALGPIENLPKKKKKKPELPFSALTKCLLLVYFPRRDKQTKEVSSPGQSTAHNPCP